MVEFPAKSSGTTTPIIATDKRGKHFLEEFEAKEFRTWKHLSIEYVHVFMFLSMYLSIYLSIYLSTCLSILFYSILFYSILFYSILFYSILFYSILSYPILSYPILSYPILSYPILSYLSMYLSIYLSILIYMCTYTVMQIKGWLRVASWSLQVWNLSVSATGLWLAGAMLVSWPRLLPFERNIFWPIGSTPWKFNIAPEKLPSQSESIVFQPPFFRTYCWWK